MAFSLCFPHHQSGEFTTNKNRVQLAPVENVWIAQDWLSSLAAQHETEMQRSTNNSLQKKVPLMITSELSSTSLFAHHSPPEPQFFPSGGNENGSVSCYFVGSSIAVCSLVVKDNAAGGGVVSRERKGEQPYFASSLAQPTTLLLPTIPQITEAVGQSIPTYVLPFTLPSPLMAVLPYHRAAGKGPLGNVSSSNIALSALVHTVVLKAFLGWSPGAAGSGSKQSSPTTGANAILRTQQANRCSSRLLRVLSSLSGLLPDDPTQSQWILDFFSPANANKTTLPSSTSAEGSVHPNSGGEINLDVGSRGSPYCVLSLHRVNVKQMVANWTFLSDTGLLKETMVNSLLKVLLELSTANLTQHLSSTVPATGVDASGWEGSIMACYEAMEVVVTLHRWVSRMQGTDIPGGGTRSGSAVSNQPRVFLDDTSLVNAVALALLVPTELIEMFLFTDLAPPPKGIPSRAIRPSPFTAVGALTRIDLGRAGQMIEWLANSCLNSVVELANNVLGAELEDEPESSVADGQHGFEPTAFGKAPSRNPTPRRRPTSPQRRGGSPDRMASSVSSMKDIAGGGGIERSPPQTHFKTGIATIGAASSSVESQFRVILNAVEVGDDGEEENSGSRSDGTSVHNCMSSSVASIRRGDVLAGEDPRELVFGVSPLVTFSQQVAEHCRNASMKFVLSTATPTTSGECDDPSSMVFLSTSVVAEAAHPGTAAGRGGFSGARWPGGISERLSKEGEQKSEAPTTSTVWPAAIKKLKGLVGTVYRRSMLRCGWQDLPFTQPPQYPEIDDGTLDTLDGVLVEEAGDEEEWKSFHRRLQLPLRFTSSPSTGVAVPLRYLLDTFSFLRHLPSSLVDGCFKSGDKDTPGEVRLAVSRLQALRDKEWFGQLSDKYHFQCKSVTQVLKHYTNILSLTLLVGPFSSPAQLKSALGETPGTDIAFDSAQGTVRICSFHGLIKLYHYRCLMRNLCLLPQLQGILRAKWSYGRYLRPRLVSHAAHSLLLIQRSCWSALSLMAVSKRQKTLLVERKAQALLGDKLRPPERRRSMLGGEDSRGTTSKGAAGASPTPPSEDGDGDDDVDLEVTLNVLTPSRTELQQHVSVYNRLADGFRDQEGAMLKKRLGEVETLERRYRSLVLSREASSREAQLHSHYRRVFPLIGLQAQEERERIGLLIDRRRVVATLIVEHKEPIFRMVVERQWEIHYGGIVRHHHRGLLGSMEQEELVARAKIETHWGGDYQFMLENADVASSLQDLVLLASNMRLEADDALLAWQRKKNSLAHPSQDEGKGPVATQRRVHMAALPRIQFLREQSMKCEEIASTLFAEKLFFTKREAYERKRMVATFFVRFVELEETHLRRQVRHNYKRFWERSFFDEAVSRLKLEERRARNRLALEIAVLMEHHVSRLITVEAVELECRQVIQRVCRAEFREAIRMTKQYEEVFHDQYTSPSKIVGELEDERATVRRLIAALEDPLSPVHQRLRAAAGYPFASTAGGGDHARITERSHSPKPRTGAPTPHRSQGKEARRSYEFESLVTTLGDRPRAVAPRAAPRPSSSSYRHSSATTNDEVLGELRSYLSTPRERRLKKGYR